jgi:alpha-mannosidase
MKKLHLVCNAHLDPVWQWEWEEGLAAAIATFRTAAELCEEFEGFVFNHNEALLYVWIEEHDPVLFKRIQKLVRQGKWHIMGGWYVQPDCNMPSGESFVRQILLGKTYFEKKFGRFPDIAVNVDSFGHTRGLVQILLQSGYKGYLFMRPDAENLELPDEPFLWQGLHGGAIPAMRFPWGYNSALGKAREKADKFIQKFSGKDTALLLWGVGNHGGGPSRKDLRDLRDLIRSGTAPVVRHSTPEAYFREALVDRKDLVVKACSFRPFAPGCYTTQARIKQKHRLLENEYFATEKMCTAAWLRTGMPYPREVLTAVSRDLALAQFHDILPGSSVQPVEEMALRLMDHGLEELSRVKTRAFLRLSAGAAKARANEIPVLVYNPHPYPVDTVVECEFMLADQNWSGSFFRADAYRGSRRLPSQIEKEHSNIPLDWRKRIVFRATLAPSQMNRFDCRLTELPKKPAPPDRPGNTPLAFSSDALQVRISRRTGLMESMKARGRELLGRKAFQALVIQDSEDAWGITAKRFDTVAGQFKLMSSSESARFAGIKAKTLPPVRVIEDGSVRTVVEALFKHRQSSICLRYKLPKKGSEVEVEARVFWHEKDSMLKLALPLAEKPARVLGQTAFGCEELFLNGDENVSQKWLLAVPRHGAQALTVINDGTYGSSVHDNELRLTLLRSPAYTGHSLPNRTILSQDRFTPRIDQGERLFRFWINGGDAASRLAAVDREALVCNEKPMALSCFPSGAGKRQKGAFLEVAGAGVQLSAVKQAESDKHEFIVRLFESSGRSRRVVVKLPGLGISRKVAFTGFELKTFRINVRTKRMVATNLMEQVL